MATLDVINLEKQKVGTIDLSDAIYAAPVDERVTCVPSARVCVLSVITVAE